MEAKVVQEDEFEQKPLTPGLFSLFEEYDRVLDEMYSEAEEIKTDFENYIDTSNALRTKQPGEISRMFIKIARYANTVSFKWAYYTNNNSKELREQRKNPDSKEILIGTTTKDGKSVPSLKYSKWILRKHCKDWELDKVLEIEERFAQMRKTRETIGKVRRRLAYLNEEILKGGYLSLEDDESSKE
jgi:hypothetical protein